MVIAAKKDHKLGCFPGSIWKTRNFSNEHGLIHFIQQLKYSAKDFASGDAQQSEKSASYTMCAPRSTQLSAVNTSDSVNDSLNTMKGKL